MDSNLISLVGLVVILGIGWAMSYHPRSVRLRVLFWGVGLQFLMAVIVLRDDPWSFVGMAVLAMLILLYQMRQDQKKLMGSVWVWGAVVAGAATVVARAAGMLSSPVLGAVLGVVLLAILVNARFRLVPAAQRYAGALVVVLGVTWLATNELYGHQIFEEFSHKVAGFLSLSDYGAQFLFAHLADGKYYDPTSTWPGFGFQFAFKVLPTIIFFGGFMGVLYYLGIMQKVIEAMAKFMRWTVGTSGAETLSCTANVFVGQTEAPLLIKPFLEGMTRSELLTVMVGGFGTIAGGVLAGYIALGIPAAHLIAASVMAAPGSLMMGKLVFPEREHSETAGDTKMPDIAVGGNVIEAASNGITDGFKLAANVAAMLIGFIALIAVVDVLLNYLDSLIDGKLLQGAHYAYAAAGLSPAKGEFAGWFPGSLQTLFGTALRPLAYLMGVPWKDSAAVGNLLGVKLSLNEFVAYGTLHNYIDAGSLSPRAVIISTYALCGFANFSSIGIQIGGISAIAPSRKADLAKIGLKAMFAGALVSMFTATIAGLLL